MLVSRYAAAFVLLFFFLATSAYIVHVNSLHMKFTWQRTDECPTLARGVKWLDPFGEKYASSTGNTTRWFVRLLYPLGVYYMNTRMGGGAYEPPGSKGPGGFYLREALSPSSCGALRAVFDRDPNVQDFAFFMRVAFGAMAAGCFCLVLWALFRRFNTAAAAAYGSLILGNSIVSDRFLVFYSETSLFVIFNLAAFLCLRYRAATWRTVVYLGILSAAALSTKLTGILIAAPAFLYVAFGMRGPGRGAAPRIEVFLLLFLASALLINADYDSMSHFFDMRLKNVWHYKAGHDLVAAGGLDYLDRMVEDMGWLIFPLFVAGLSWFARSPRRRLVPVYALGACVVLVLYSLLDASFYVTRNLAPVYVAMSFIAALGVGDLVRRLSAKRPSAGTIASAGLTLTLLANGVFLVRELPPLDDEFLSRTWKSVQSCASIAAIGLPEKDLRVLRKRAERAGGDVTVLPGIRAPFVLSRNLGSRSHIARFLEENPGHIFDGLDGYDCLVAYREGHTKQVTNFFAPKHYTLKTRVGDRFFYVR